MQILKRGLEESLVAQRHSRTRSSSLGMEYSVTEKKEEEFLPMRHFSCHAKASLLTEMRRLDENAWHVTSPFVSTSNERPLKETTLHLQSQLHSTFPPTEV